MVIAGPGRNLIMICVFRSTWKRRSRWLVVNLCRCFGRNPIFGSGPCIDLGIGRTVELRHENCNARFINIIPNVAARRQQQILKMPQRLPCIIHTPGAGRAVRRRWYSGRTVFRNRFEKLSIKFIQHFRRRVLTGKKLNQSTPELVRVGMTRIMCVFD